MKTIQLIRHAKSSWEYSHLSDRNRPLSNRGIKDCKIMADALHQAGINFSHIYCSVAQRAQLTIQGVAEHWQGVPLDWQVTDAMYTFSSSQIWQLARCFDDQFDQVCLVGHNPAFTDFINEASGSDLENLPTCAYAEILFNENLWQDLGQQPGELAQLLRPKMFK